jgi:hypothetical protein
MTQRKRTKEISYAYRIMKLIATPWIAVAFRTFLKIDNDQLSGRILVMLAESAQGHVSGRSYSQGGAKADCKFSLLVIQNSAIKFSLRKGRIPINGLESTQEEKRLNEEPYHHNPIPASPLPTESSRRSNSDLIAQRSSTS